MMMMMMRAVLEMSMSSSGHDENQQNFVVTVSWLIHFGTA